MDIPVSVTTSGLFKRLSVDEELKAQIISLRNVVEAFAATTARSVPNFTDHTVRHMDALWGVTDQVFTTSEIQKMTCAEAFVLACGFYLHDIGMAYAGTIEGLEKIQASPPYRGFIASILPKDRNDPDMILRAIAVAIRKLHARAAIDLATSAIPGTDVHLFEGKLFREAWVLTCGRVAASHHWGLEQVGREFGAQGTIPLPGNRRGDLQFVACALRIIDYAHINRDRAPTLERAFRKPLEKDSLIHWLAQESIDGPTRDENELVYRAARPIADVEAWWLYYEMLVGLDDEIRGVRRLLDRSVVSKDRFSLAGVRGAAAPSEASILIPTDKFLPIEVNLRTGSIERLVELLAGETLYGPNPMVAVRELLQNSRDAVLLKAAIASSDIDRAQQSLPVKVSLSTTVEPAKFEITDYGVGMSRVVMTDYLISIASDYWSSQFASDFPAAAEAGFKPAGKFGIGFLSAFMLGDRVSVESNRAGNDRYRMTLRGVGRRGELYQIAGATGSGTTIEIELKAKALERLTPLVELIKAFAPTFPHDIEVSVNGNKTLLPSGWLGMLTSSDFLKWLAIALRPKSLTKGARNPQREFSYTIFERYFRNEREFLSPWPLKSIEYRDGRTRLVASFGSTSLLCLKGLAVQSIGTPGFAGVIDLTEGAPDVSRSRIGEVDISGVLSKARSAIESQVQDNLSATDGLMIDKTQLLENSVRYYGSTPLRKSNLRWISYLRLPGEVVLVSCDDLLNKLRDADSLFVSFTRAMDRTQKLVI